MQGRIIPERAQNKIRRATASRRRAAADQIREYERESNVTLGPITRYYSSIQHARQPDGTPYALGQGNTIRQMQVLDEEGARLRQEREEAAEARTSVAQPMRLLINGVWVEFKVDIVLMRTVLGLPPENMYHGEIFQPYQEPTVEGEDVEDDHADSHNNSSNTNRNSSLEEEE